MSDRSYSPLKYRAAGLQCDGAPPAASAAASAGAAAAAAEFVWQRAERPAHTSDHGTRLAAAAEMAKRCVELGVRPPLPPPPAHPPQQGVPPPAPPPAPASQAARLEALVEQMQQHSTVLSSAVQGQSRQLAAQQQMLADVVQGLMFVGAKTGAGSRASAPAAPGAGTASAAGQQQRKQMDGAAPVPGRPAAALTPRHRAEVVQGLAAGLRPTAAAARGARGWDDEPAPWATPSPGSGRDGPTDSRPASPPCGMLRVPEVPAPAEETSSPAISPIAREQKPAPDGRYLDRRHTPRGAAAAAQPEQRRRGSSCGEISRDGRRVPGSRPSWNDRTVIERERQPRGRQPAELAPPPPGRHLVGGLGPQLLLQELRRLQRRRTTGGIGGHPSGSGRGDSARRGLQTSFREAGRPLTAPAASSRPEPPIAAPVSGRERLLRAKHAALLGSGKLDIPAGGVDGASKGVRFARPIQLYAGHRAAAAALAAGRASEAASKQDGAALPHAPAAAPAKPGQTGQRMAAAGMQLPEEQQGHLQAAGIGSRAVAPLAASGSAVAGEVGWEQLSEEDVEVVCDRICRQLLLGECTLSAHSAESLLPVPAC